MNFRIRKGTHFSHFHEKCPLWPKEHYYEQEKPLWWGKLCAECARLVDNEAGITLASSSNGKREPAAGSREG